MSEPSPLSEALSKLIALRGLARKQGDAQLQQAWLDVAGPVWGGKSRAMGIKRGVLQISVTQGPLLSELVSFHRLALLAKFKEKHPHLRIRDLKFRLDGGIRTSGAHPE